MSDPMKIIVKIPPGEFTGREQANIHRDCVDFSMGRFDVLTVPSGVEVRVVGEGPLPEVSGGDIRSAFDYLLEGPWKRSDPLMEWLNFKAVQCEYRDGKS